MRKNIIYDYNAKNEFRDFSAEVRDDFTAYIETLEQEGVLKFPEARKVTKDIFEIRIYHEGAYRGFYSYMNYKRSAKIQKAIDEGLLIPHEEEIKGLSKERRKRIDEKVRYLRASMELRRLRQEANYSQEKLAKKMKVKRSFIARIESGMQNVTLETLYRIADAMGKEFYFAFK